MKRFFLSGLLLCSLACLMAGCIGYQRGSSVPEGYRSVHLAAFENNTAFPMVGALVSQQTLDALIEDGTFRPTGYDKARLRIQGIITGLGSRAVNYQNDNRDRPNEFRLTLHCALYVYDAIDGSTLIDGKPLQISEGFLTNDDYQTGLQNALPRASRELAQAILRELHTL